MTESSPAAITVTDHPEHMRYELHVGQQLAGFTQYRLRPGRVVFAHTEIDDAFEGQGLGGKLAKAALDDVRARGLQVTPLCPFIAGWIKRHPEYVDLVHVSTDGGSDSDD